LTLETNSGTTAVNGQISGAGGLIKTGGGTVVLAVANTYTGVTQIEAGTLTLQDAQALGTADGTAATGTTVNGGSSLLLDGSFTVSSELLSLGGPEWYSRRTLRSSGNAEWTGNINVGGTSNLVVDSGHTLTLSGDLTGATADVRGGAGWS
jgi:autotransporter-associated beta strand protein